MLAIINDILDLAKIEAGRMRVHIARFDLPALLQDTLALFQQRAQERHLTLGLTAGAVPRMVAGDVTKLRQVLINLLGNAIKFTPEGGRITLSAEARADDRIRFCVEDTGVGIAAEELVELFDPFTQAEADRRQ